MPKYLTEEIKKKVIDIYRDKPISLTELSKKVNVSIPKIIEILNNANIPRYTRSRIYSPDLKEDFFESIDTEDKAYFLGLILADGCIYKSSTKENLVTLTLQESDKYILDYFIKVLNSNKIATSDKRGAYSIQIFSNKMVSDLEKYGLTERKSLHTIFPKMLNPNIYNHFIRGIFDGDGSYSFYTRKNRNVHVKAIRLCQGNKEFLEDILNYLHSTLGIKTLNLYKEKENLWSFAYRDNDSMLKLGTYLYDNANIYIKRKHLTWLKIYNEILTYTN